MLPSCDTQYAPNLILQHGSTTYDYDFLGQLISAESYTYDSNGNRLTANGDNYTTSTNNELTSDGVWSYTYDDEGNRISKQNSTNRELYEWDYRNRLTKVTQQTYNAETETWITTQTIEYTYDYNNVWIRKVVGNDKTIFIPENYQTVTQIDNNTITHHYLWTPNQQDKLLADVTTNDVLWALTDHLGTICDIIGNSTTHLIYDAFGNLIFGTTPILFAYTGKAFDVDTQLQNNINRWYDPTTGRWLSTDPIGFEGNDTNLYRYIKNTVLKFLDTFGREPLCPVIFDPVLGIPVNIPLSPTTQNSDSLELISELENLTFEEAYPLVIIIRVEKSYECFPPTFYNSLENNISDFRHLLRNSAMDIMVTAPKIKKAQLENLRKEKINLTLKLLGTAINTNLIDDALALEMFSQGEYSSAIQSVVAGHFTPQQISAMTNVKDCFFIIIKEDQIYREYENNMKDGEELLKRSYY